MIDLEEVALGVIIAVVFLIALLVMLALRDRRRTNDKKEKS